MPAPITVSLYESRFCWLFFAYIEIAGCAGSLGYPGWDDGTVPALSNVSVASLSELLGSGRTPSALLLPPGHFVPSLRLPEQVEPAETINHQGGARSNQEE